MTWKEFKDKVEEELAKQNLTEDVRIGYIDINDEIIAVEISEYGWVNII